VASCELHSNPEAPTGGHALAHPMAVRPEAASMTRDAGSRPYRLQVAALALAIILLGVREGGSSHSTPPPPPPPGHGQLLVRLVLPAGERGGLPYGQVRVEAIELHRVGAAASTWVRLPLVRTEFAPAELLGGQVWVVDVPLPAGEYDQIRVQAGGRSQIAVALSLISGKWSILSLEAGFESGRGQGALRLTVSRPRTEGPY